MKLRNKKTGEIVEYESFGFRKGLSNGWNDFIPSAHSLTGLNEDWEDYTPTEPLIKDEKVRKAVWAWAEANEVERVDVLYHSVWELSMTEIAKNRQFQLKNRVLGRFRNKEGLRHY